MWLYVAQARVGAAQPGVLPSLLSAYGKRGWPAPVVQFYLGQIDETRLRALAGADAANKRARLCEADFFLGELALLRNDPRNARLRFEHVVESCSTYYYAHRVAAGELARLRAAPAPLGGRVS